MLRSSRTATQIRAAEHAIFLIPGFFGFTNLGQLKYFGHVRDFLVRRSKERGISASVYVVKTPPTASLPKRAVRVLEAIEAANLSDRKMIHLIGHSSGGLDARLLTAPGVSLPTELDVARHTRGIRSVVTVATPHHGTPLASFFASRLGEQLLETLSLSTIYLLRFGHLPLRPLLQIGALFARWDQMAVNSTLLDEVFGRLLGRFSVGRRRAVQALLAQVAHDRALRVQLTPEAMEVFNAAVHDRPGVRYASVVTLAASPGLRSLATTGFDASGQAVHAVYAALYRLVKRNGARLPQVSASQARVLKRAYGVLPNAGANDGIVPTRSQVWGEVLCAVRADHLDVIGHFNGAAERPRHVDWLASGTGFSCAAFSQVWSSVLDTIASNAATPVSRVP
jgi:triacylglycerol esterase/lipase EstA (alpha/beta hydrolase family)